LIQECRSANSCWSCSSASEYFTPFSTLLASQLLRTHSSSTSSTAESAVGRSLGSRAEQGSQTGSSSVGLLEPEPKAGS